MKNKLLELIGKKVTQSVLIHDYIQLEIGNANLSIYNNYDLVNCSVTDLIGEDLKALDVSGEQVDFSFSNNKHLIVKLSNENWNGPEAMQLIISEHESIYVWQD